MNILVHIIPHNCQRYPTVGDWCVEGNSLHIHVSNMGDSRYEFLVGLHEQIEAFLCIERGITGKQVDEFDFAFKGDNEPGDDPNAPYRKEHFHATNIERLVAEQLGVVWHEYEAAIDNLFEEEQHVHL